MVHPAGFEPAAYGFEAIKLEFPNLSNFWDNLVIAPARLSAILPISRKFCEPVITKRPLRPLFASTWALMCRKKAGAY